MTKINYSDEAVEFVVPAGREYDVITSASIARRCLPMHRTVTTSLAGGILHVYCNRAAPSAKDMARFLAALRALLAVDGIETELEETTGVKARAIEARRARKESRERAIAKEKGTS